jgi:5,10-methylenetetrahydromethanopterin reductase
MKLGINFPPGRITRHAQIAAATESSGVDLLGVSDSQAGEYRDCYVALGSVVANTSHLLTGPMVTNPLTRHPAVTASAISTADEQSGGRCILAISTGDSGVYNLGLRPANLAKLEEYIHVLRGLFTGEPTRYGEHTLQLAWATRQIPVYMGAEGPRSLRMAGRIADGVVVGGGLLPEVVESAMKLIDDGARSVGRNIGDIDVWFMGKAALGDSRESAIQEVRASLASSANHVFRFTLEGKAVPDEYRAAIAELQARYDVTQHNVPGADNPNANLVDELGLTNYLAERFGILGNEADCVDRLSTLKALGVAGVLARPLVNDEFEFLSRWKKVVEDFRAQ